MHADHGDAAGRPPSDRRTVILGRARDLFLERGYSVISMQQIADAVGINKATLYHHFRDKDDLFTAVLGQELDIRRRDLEEIIDAGGTTREIVERVARNTIEFADGDMPSLFMSLKNEVSEERRAAFFAGRELPWAAMRPLFVAAIDRNEFRSADPDVLVELFFSLTRSQAPGPWRSRPAPPIDEAVRSVVSLFLDGAMARPETESLVVLGSVARSNVEDEVETTHSPRRSVR